MYRFFFSFSEIVSVKCVEEQKEKTFTEVVKQL